MPTPRRPFSGFAKPPIRAQPPAGTSWATVMVVSFKFSDVRLSQEAALAWDTAVAARIAE